MAQSPSLQHMYPWLSRALRRERWRSVERTPKWSWRIHSPGGINPQARGYGAGLPAGNVLSFCIVGAGPAGFYTAEKLLKLYAGARVDLLDRLPTPFGLVRSGVAPDHPETKLVINQFTRVASNDRCRFLGNVHVGTDVTLAELRQMYSAVVLAYGAESDRSLGVPGESLAGVWAAREFVWWFNGHPDAAAGSRAPPDLSSTDTAVVLGQGNVALDVARILTRRPDELAATDIAEHALEALRSSTIRRVLLVGRRGPAQAACTAKELRELLGLKGVHVNVEAADLTLSDTDKEELRRSRSHKRVFELFNRASAAEAPTPGMGLRQIDFVFFRSPRSFVPLEGQVAQLGAVQLEKTTLQGGGSGVAQRAVGTGELQCIPCGLALRSIGYKSVAIPALPFDQSQGVVPNKLGKVLTSYGSSSECQMALYVVGWLKRGPTGIIGSNLVDADETVSSIKEDEEGSLLRPVPDPYPSVRGLLSERGIVSVSFDGWARIDEEELKRGVSKGKPREKIVAVDEMMEIVQQQATQNAVAN